MTAETVGALLAAAEEALHALGNGRLDAELLLEQVLHCGRTWLYAHPEAAVAPGPAGDFRLLVDHRREGFPVAYLTGKKEFWSLPFTVTRHTLIPRPETEHVVETALALAPDAASPDVLDLGTGCGAIALAVAAERPAWRVTGADVSVEALSVARENARRLGFTNVEFHCSDWFSAFGNRRFDLILCNPPYVDSRDPGLHDSGLRFEPRLALDGGHGGLEAVRRIVAAAIAHLRDGGVLVLEHGLDQGTQVRFLMHQAGFREIRTGCDHAGMERVSTGRHP